jgi:hypothetical protein
MPRRRPDLTLSPTPIKEPPVAAKQRKVSVSPDQGVHFLVLDRVHKITTDRSGGSLTIEEWGLPRGR